MGPDNLERLDRRLTRLVLVAFLFTFMAARVLVFLIMDRSLPDLYLHLGGTHVHHLNYGIFLIAATGAYLLFVPPERQTRTTASALYGIGLALTFDEFGMWLHLGGGYWQRASFDAVVVIAGLLALLAFAPSFDRLRRSHLRVGVMILLSVSTFFVFLIRSLQSVEKRYELRWQRLEEQGPP